MPERTTLTGNGTWTQIGTGPATVQVLTPDVEVMVKAAASPTTEVDGLVLGNGIPTHYFTEAQTIYAQVVQSRATAIVDVQPEA